MLIWMRVELCCEEILLAFGRVNGRLIDQKHFPSMVVA
jgi:hypothetical protein